MSLMNACEVQPLQSALNELLVKCFRPAGKIGAFGQVPLTESHFVYTKSGHFRHWGSSQYQLVGAWQAGQPHRTRWNLLELRGVGDISWSSQGHHSEDAPGRSRVAPGRLQPPTRKLSFGGFTGDSGFAPGREGLVLGSPG